MTTTVSELDARPLVASTRRHRPLASRLWTAPLAAHAAALTLVLLALLGVGRPDRMLNADEGAAASQASALAEGEGWLRAHPLPEADPDGDAFPLELSARRADTFDFAPFAKHPAYPALLAGPMRLGGVPLAATVSVAGTVLAALGAALVARRVGPGLERIGLWVAGLASPLLFDSFLMIAHTLGAAAVAFGVAAALGYRERPRLSTLLAASAAVAVGVLLRNEVVLFGGAFAAVLAVDAALRRSARDGILAVGILVATGSGYASDTVLESWVLRDGGATPFVIDSSDGMLADRVHAFRNTVLSPPDGGSLATLGAVLATVLLVAAVAMAKRADRDVALILVLAVASAVAAVGWAVQEPVAIVPGLLFAFPLGVAGIAGMRRDDLASPTVRVLALTGALFALGVVATQYRNSGVAWGGRYFAVALPVVVPLAVLGLQHTSATLTPSARRTFMASVMVVATAFGAVSVAAVRYGHDRDAALASTLERVTPDVDAGDGDPRPVVVVTDPAVGRLSWRLVDEQRWLLVDASEVGAYGERLRAAGIERFVLVDSRLQASLDQLSSRYRPVGEAAWTVVSWPIVGTATLAPAAQIVELSR